MSKAPKPSGAIANLQKPAERAKDESDLCACPECGHVFQGNGWDGIDAHWKAKHSEVMPYDAAWPLIKAGNYAKTAKLQRAPEERAEIERLAREHGADLSEKRIHRGAKEKRRHQAAISAQPSPSTLVHDVAISVGHDLQEAVAAYEVYRPSATIIDFEALRKSDYSQSFIVVRASLYRIVLLALCRIWDQARSDRYSLKKLIELMQNQEVIKTYTERGSFDAEKVQALIIAYKNVLVSKELESIKTVRDSWIAHTASRARIAMQEVKPAVYGDELKLIEMTAPIVFDVAASVQCALIPIDIDRDMWQRQGTSFWGRVSRARSN